MTQLELAVRRIAMATVYGGTGLGLATVAAAGLLMGQARLARHTIPRAEAPPPRSDGRYGAEFTGEPIRLVLLGDSTAAGLGVDRPRDTPGALLAAGLAERLHRPVLLRNFGVSGAESAGLEPQVERALAANWSHRLPGEGGEAGLDGDRRACPDAVVILTGANDVTHGVRVPAAVTHLARAVRQLRTAGCAVVVGTCPDLGTIRPVQPPLRWVARHMSRELARAQTVAVVQEGGATVSLGDLVGPMFYAAPRQMFSADRFHPSADGYAAAAAAMLPTLIAAVTGETGAAQVGAAAGHEEGVRSLARAAVQASEQAGTEVSAGGWWVPGRWVQLRHRVRQLTVRRQDPTPPGVADARPGRAHPARTGRVSTVE